MFCPHLFYEVFQAIHVHLSSSEITHSVPVFFWALITWVERFLSDSPCHSFGVYHFSVGLLESLHVMRLSHRPLPCPSWVFLVPYIEKGLQVPDCSARVLSISGELEIVLRVQCLHPESQCSGLVCSVTCPSIRTSPCSKPLALGTRNSNSES